MHPTLIRTDLDLMIGKIILWVRVPVRIQCTSCWEQMLFIFVHSRLISSVLCLLSGLLKDGYELISQALTLFSSVCGVLHEDVSMCLRLLGRLSYILGEYADVNMHYCLFLLRPFIQPGSRLLNHHPHLTFCEVISSCLWLALWLQTDMSLCELW